MKLIEKIRDFFYSRFYRLFNRPEETPPVPDRVQSGTSTHPEKEQTGALTSQPDEGNKSKGKHPIVSKTYTVKTCPFLTSNLKLDCEATYKVQYSVSDSIDAKFPIIRAPNRGCEIKLPVHSRSGKRGVSEEKLCAIIKELKLLNFYDDLSLFVGDYSNPYEPDITYINAQKGIFIDVEIDEPYSGWERKPIHYKTKDGTIDDLRNLYFTERGWAVIRFSEKQVYEHPKSCLKRVYQLLCKMDATITMPQCLATESDISLEDMWTEEQAKRKGQNKEREKMLDIDKFSMPIEGPHKILEDYPKGKILEKKIKKAKVIVNPLPTSPKYNPPPLTIGSSYNPDTQRRIEAEQYEHPQQIVTQSSPKTTPSSRGYA